MATAPSHLSRKNLLFTKPDGLEILSLLANLAILGLNSGGGKKLKAVTSWDLISNPPAFSTFLPFSCMSYKQLPANATLLIFV